MNSPEFIPSLVGREPKAACVRCAHGKVPAGRAVSRPSKRNKFFVGSTAKILANMGSTTTGNLVNDGETLLYLASTRDCRSCPLKPQCCPNMPARRIPRSIYEESRDIARALMFEQSRRDRKRVEMLYAHLKRILRLGRLRLRGPRGAQFEFMLAAIAQNLRRLAKLVARPPPLVAACAA
jgi:hypothetical protein